MKLKRWRAPCVSVKEKGYPREMVTATYLYEEKENIREKNAQNLRKRNVSRADLASIIITVIQPRIYILP